MCGDCAVPFGADVLKEDLLEVVLEELDKTIDSLNLSTDSADKDELENKITFYKRELEKAESQEKRLVKKFVEDMINESIYDELKAEIDTKRDNFNFALTKTASE